VAGPQAGGRNLPSVLVRIDAMATWEMCYSTFLDRSQNAHICRELSRNRGADTVGSSSQRALRIDLELSFMRQLPVIELHGACHSSIRFGTLTANAVQPPIRALTIGVYVGVRYAIVGRSLPRTSVAMASIACAARQFSCVRCAGGVLLGIPQLIGLEDHG
jgi:hypothetical protein